ncbi:multisubunit sodium/proton antiporter, MrpG subunit [Alkalispirochaeta americana]|uniref:Multisubunit sodium/proton antiporter, MrpG subunit n=1 Tax=Alkalispirochaeta americana TaxID=159291 RepID=A0A1N6QR61_9SPIO|nr:monovalent cation/H(+) antiporter subunit G [Alkalispirochaeta americana]SIQ19055.1 multisubunit sodium/proton antiporter, MrpG subunit [Alkalispirochaeta americana]
MSVLDLVPLLGKTIMVLGLLITLFGVYAVLRLDGFYARVVVTSKVEALGFMTVIAGAILLSGFSPVSLKLLLILLFELLTVSAGAHAIVRSAWISGYRARTVTTREAPRD